MTIEPQPKARSEYGKEWPLVIILLLPFVAFALALQSLPDRVPMHFDIHGNVNRYGSPWSLIILPCVNLGLAVLLYFIPLLDPKQKNIAASMPAYRWIRIALALLLDYIFAITVATCFNPKLDVQPLIACGVLALFFVLGLVMHKLKQNYMIGIRLPWTLESEDNWNRTHAFGGKLWMWGSLVGIALALLFPSISIFIVIAWAIGMTIIIGVYSYKLFQKEKKIST